MIQGGVIRFVLTGDTKSLDKASDDAKKKLSDLRTEFKNNITESAKFASAVVAAGAAISIGLTVRGLAAVDAQAKLARSLGGTVNGLNALRSAAGDAGIDGLEGSLNRMNRRLGAVEMEGGPALKTIQRLGIDLDYIQKLDVDEKLAYISDRIVESGVSSQEAARHLQQLGFEQRAAVELFASGGGAIRKYRAEVDALGLAMTDLDTTKVEMANDAMGIFGDVTQAVQQRLAIGMAPTLATIAGLIEDAWIQTDNFGLSSAEFERKFANAIATALEAVASFLRFFENRSEIASFGLIGYVMFGKKGAAIGGIIGAAFAAINSELRKMGVGVDDNAARLARMMERAEGLNRALSGAQDSQSRGQNMNREITNYEAQLALVNGEIETLRATMSEDSWADFNRYFVEGGSAAGKMADGLDTVAEAIRNGVDAQNAAAGARAAGRPDLGSGSGAAPGMTEDEIESLKVRLEQLAESFMTEKEMLMVKYEEERELLRQSLENGLLDRDEYADMVEDSARRHQDSLTEIDLKAAEDRKRIAEMEARAKYAVANAIFGDLSTLMNTESRRLFEIGKAAGIANAIVDTHAGMAKALAQGGWAGIAMAAAVGVKGYASISAIRSQSFGGGGAAAMATESNTAAANAAATPAGGSASSPMTTVIKLQGTMFGATQVRELIEQLNEGQRDGGRIVLG